MSTNPLPPTPEKSDMIGRAIDGVIRFCLENKLILVLVLVAIVGWAVMVMPFDYDLSLLPRDPVPVDAIPDISENQQIVFTEWPGRSPQDVEDQITYPLTVLLLGVPGVKTVRSQSMFGFSSISVVFDEDVDFYWARSRILERLSVAQKELPEGVTPVLGPTGAYTAADPCSNQDDGPQDIDQRWKIGKVVLSSCGIIPFKLYGLGEKLKRGF